MEKYFYEAFENMSRLGPGCETSTLKAISNIDKTRPVKILDIGCGIGVHTFIIANKIKNAEIIPLDNVKVYIDKVNDKALKLGLSHRVKGVCMSMFDMTFEDNSFDYIFAEGSIYIAGFTNGLSQWKRLLKKGGKIICSEICFTTDIVSDKVKTYWESNYPQIDSVANKILKGKKLGYNTLTHFPLPTKAWTDNYYVPLAKNLKVMKEKYKGNQEALGVVALIEEEIELYYKYGKEYNYFFFELHFE